MGGTWEKGIDKSTVDSLIKKDQQREIQVSPEPPAHQICDIKERGENRTELDPSFCYSLLKKTIKKRSPKLPGTPRCFLNRGVTLSQFSSTSGHHTAADFMSLSPPE